MRQNRPEDMPLQLVSSSPLASYIRPQAHSHLNSNQCKFDQAPLQFQRCLDVSAKVKAGERLLTANSTHSLSKWACTEVSTQEHKQNAQNNDQDEAVPLWKQLCANHSPELEILGEATFKPKDLKKYLRPEKELKELVKRSLRDSSGKENRGGKKNRTSIVQEGRGRGKTRYQKILEEFFLGQKQEKPQQHQKKERKERKEGKEGKEGKEKYRTAATGGDQYVVLPGRPVRQHSLRHLQAQPIMDKQGRVRQNMARTVSLAKTINSVGMTRSLSQLGFMERQRELGERRREKEQKEREGKQKKELQGCTFHPEVRGREGARGRVQGVRIEGGGREVRTGTGESVGSYAKLYLERIRSRR